MPNSENYRAGMYIFLGLWLLQILFHYNTGQKFTRVCEALDSSLDEQVIYRLLGRAAASDCLSRTRPD